VIGRVDIITGTLGKRWRRERRLHQRRKRLLNICASVRPYLFSNTVAPSIVGASLKVLELLTESTALRDKLEANTKFFRDEIAKLGFNILPGAIPLCR